jgi:hypothetical protein
MNRMKTISAVLLLLLAGCTGVSFMNRLDLFQDGERVYRLALRDSDFKTAAKFEDPATRPATRDYEKYNMFKVARYKTTKTVLSDDKQEIRQEVEIQYYHQKRPVLKTLLDAQVWRFDADKKVWLLQTGLPQFE